MTPPPVPDTAPSSTGRIRAAGLVLIVAFAALLWVEPAWLSRLQASGYDLLQAAKPRQAVSQSTVIVAIDEKSIAELGQWPWPRTVLARILRYVARGRPAAIGIDVLMPERDRLSPALALKESGVTDPVLVEYAKALPSNDQLVADVMTGAPVVLALAGIAGPSRGPLRATPVVVRNVAPPGVEARTVDMPSFAGAIVNVDEIDAAASGRGAISTADSGAVVRRMPLIVDIANTKVPAFTVEMLRVAAGAKAVRLNVDGGGARDLDVGPITIPTDRDAALRIYYAPMDPARYVSAIDVYEGRVDPGRFKDAFVLVGATAVAFNDLQGTPLGVLMPGVEIQAQLIDNVVERSWLKRPSYARLLEVGLFVALALLLLWVTPRRFSPLAAAAVGVACVAVPLAVTYAAFVRDRWLFDSIVPGILLLLLFLVLLVLTLREATAQRRALEGVLQRSREDAARVAGEFAAAQRIQTGMLPAPASLGREPRVALAASMTPAREVGGDLYDFFRLDAHRLFVLIGDVSGKGLSASMFMAVSKALAKSVALRSQETDVGALMTAVNVEVSRDNPETLFVTAFAAVLDLESGELAYCNAGHDNPYLLRADGAMERIVDGDGPPLCAVDDFAYRGAARRLAKGDLVCVVTDGVTDAQNPAGELFSAARVREVLARLAGTGASADAVADTLRAEVRDFSAGAEPADDLTVLALRWNGPRAAADIAAAASAPG